MLSAMENIFKTNLGVKRSERVLVFTDLVRDDEGLSERDRKRREKVRDAAKRMAEVGKRLANIAYLEFPSTGSHGKEPPHIAWERAYGSAILEKLKSASLLERLLKKDVSKEDLELASSIVRQMREDTVDCVIALSNYSTTHTKFREFLTDFAGARYASMPNFDVSMLDDVMQADWHKIKERTVNLAQLMSGGNEVCIKTPNGSRMEFSIKDRKVVPDTGILTEEGSYGNLPAGEAFVAPVEGTAEGVMVLEWGPTRKLLSPVTLKVREGNVTEVVGEELFADELRKKLSLNPLIGNIAELGIGTNDRAKRPDNILEGEKILGTIHIAIGDNSTFGGNVSVPFHQDFVFFSPTVELEKHGKRITLLEDGKLSA